MKNYFTIDILNFTITFLYIFYIELLIKIIAVHERNNLF